MLTRSSLASSLKKRVAYRVLNFCAGWKKQTTLPSLAYAGIPYHGFGESAGALALMMAWSLLARARSGACSSSIAASTALSSSALVAAAFSSLTRDFIAPSSSLVNFAAVCVAGFCFCFIRRFLRGELFDGNHPHTREPPASGLLRI